MFCEQSFSTTFRQLFNFYDAKYEICWWGELLVKTSNKHFRFFKSSSHLVILVPVFDRFNFSKLTNSLIYICIKLLLCDRSNPLTVCAVRNISVGKLSSLVHLVSIVRAPEAWTIRFSWEILNTSTPQCGPFCFLPVWRRSYAFIEPSLSKSCVWSMITWYPGCHISNDIMRLTTIFSFTIIQ